MEFFINAIKLIAAAIIIIEIHFGFAVTVDAPTHAQIGKLVYFIHFLNGAVASLALYLSCIYMLCVIKINMIGKVMNFYPLYRFCFRRIPCLLACSKPCIIIK